MTDREGKLTYVLSFVDELRKYVGILEEERDNYELLLKYLGVYDDNVEVHRFEDVVDRIQEHDTICETVEVASVTKNKICFKLTYRDGSARTVSVPLPTPLDN